MMDPILSDKRFAKLATDKKFRSVGKKHKKVKIDKRFGSLFTNKNFVSKCSVDKRGRPKNLSAKESYEKFYKLDESSSEDENSDDDEKADKVENDSDVDAANSEEIVDNDEEQNEEEEEDDEDDINTDNLIDGKIKSKLLSSEVDYARGEGTLYSDSSSEDGGDSEEEIVNDNQDEESSEYFDKWGELDADAERTEDATERLAVCNMDWDRVGPEDLWILLSSFCPPGGSVCNVMVYLSDFGRERLEEEKTLGPQELRKLQGKDDDSSDDDVELDHIENNKKAAKREEEAMARVRQYQVNRLKYYYAVVQFDSIQTASKVYEECDGMEYELSATRLDLRFIPSDMTFDTPSTSSCSQPPDPDKYEPKQFCTTALQQGKVELTWDEEDQSKMKAMKDAFTKVDDDDEYNKMAHLIGSGSESDDDDDQNSDDEDKGTINKYKSLLAVINDKEAKDEEGNKEMTWNDEDVTEEAQEELTPWEKYLQKKKDKRKKKGKSNDDLVSNDGSDDEIPDGVDLNDPFFAEELGEDYVKTEKSKKKNKKKSKSKEDIDNQEESKDLGLMVMDSDDEKDHFNFKHIVEAESNQGKSKKKKWKKKKKELEIPVDDRFSVDVSDNRFSAMFNRHDFNIDPTNPSFKKTKNMDKILGEKQKRITSGMTGEDKNVVSSGAKKQKLDPELSQALKSVKNKWNKNARKKSKKLKFTVKDS